MRGGERVVDADNTRALLSGGSGAQITIAPQFVVNGEVSDMTEEKLQEMSERLVDMVRDALEEAGIDRQGVCTLEHIYNAAGGYVGQHIPPGVRRCEIHGRTY